jgi:hypothetical protein
VQVGLEYVEELMTTYQARLPDIDQTPEEQEALPKER